MSLEQALLTHAEALNNHAAALREAAGASAVTQKVEAKTEAKSEAVAAEKKDAPAAEKKVAPAAEKKAAAEKKKAADKPAEITDEDITAVFGPLLAKGQDEDVLASNKSFVAAINEHFGVAKLRELNQEQRATAIEWGKARAEDADFEITGASDEDEGI